MISDVDMFGAFVELGVSHEFYCALVVYIESGRTFIRTSDIINFLNHMVSFAAIAADAYSASVVLKVTIFCLCDDMSQVHLLN